MSEKTGSYSSCFLLPRLRLSELRQNQKGASAVLLAILLPFLFVSLFAIVVDVGQLYRERRELIRVSESSALYLARECANRTVNCNSNLSALQQTSYITSNSSDNKTEIIEMCGWDSARALSNSNLSQCPDSNPSLFNCKDSSIKDGSAQSGTNNYKYSFVRVRSQTLTTGDRNVIRLFFASLLSDSSKEIGLTACSQAAWSPAISVPVIYPLAVPVCTYTDGNSRLFSGFNSNDPVYNNPLGTNSCIYTPYGSNSQIVVNDRYFLKGASIYNKVNNVDFLCPSPLTPKLLKIGDVLSVQPSSSQIVRDCSSMLTSLGYGSNARGYGDFLDDYLLNRSLFIPVMGECVNQSNISQCKDFKIVGFATLKIYGITLQVSNAETGSGPTGWPSAVDWNTGTSADCSSNSYCIFGQFSRSSPPTRPVPLGPSVPPPVDAGTEQVFLLP